MSTTKRQSLSAAINEFMRLSAQSSPALNKITGYSINVTVREKSAWKLAAQLSGDTTVRTWIIRVLNDAAIKTIAAQKGNL